MRRELRGAASTSERLKVATMSKCALAPAECVPATRPLVPPPPTSFSSVAAVIDGTLLGHSHRVHLGEEQAAYPTPAQSARTESETTEFRSETWYPGCY